MLARWLNRNSHPQMAEYFGVPGGLMVKLVSRKSEAAASGLKAFDVILKVGSDSISTSADWDRSLRSNQGKPVQVTILRDKKQQTITLQVDSKHPAGALSTSRTSSTPAKTTSWPKSCRSLIRILPARSASRPTTTHPDDFSVRCQFLGGRVQGPSQHCQILGGSMSGNPGQSIRGRWNSVRKQVEGICRRFRLGSRMKQLQKQIEKFQQQMQQCQHQNAGHFV